MNTQKAITLSVFAAALLSACGGAAAPAPTTAPTSAPAARPTLPPATAVPTAAASSGAKLPAVDPLKVTGNIVTAGSSTVFPLSQRIAEIFKDEGYKGLTTRAMTDYAIALRNVRGGDVVFATAPFSGYGTSPQGASIDIVDEAGMAELGEALRTDSMDTYLDVFVTP